MKRAILFIFTTFLFQFQSVTSQSIKSPEEVFGFQMGTDKKLINWHQIVSYFTMLDENSQRVQVVELGRTTLDRPMIMAIIGSEEVLENLQTYQNIQKQLARPFDVDESKVDRLIQNGKLVFLITLNIHSTEIASSQESVELAYELATSNDVKIQRILESVIVLLVPSLNPDGQDIVAKWYLHDVGTEYEGSRMPMKYHHYAGHDNNRDWFFFNLKESQHVARVLYHDWYPEIVYDQHQMGSSGARLFLPPYADPVNPNVPPALMASVNMLGKHVVADMHDQGFKGVVTGTIFNAFFEGTMSKTPLWHNRVGILTEAASVRIASPLYFPKTSLRGMGLDLPEYTQQTNFLDPWPGGWWRLRDIIEYEKAATYSMLDLAANYKEKFKKNFYRLNRQAIETGKQGTPFAYVVPTEQHDPNSAIEMLKRLRFANVDIYQAQEDFSTSEGEFNKGSFIIPLSQPSRAYIKDLMEVQQYPDLREYPGGPPRQPYDVTGWTLPLQMGVRVVEVDVPFSTSMTLISDPKLSVDANAIAPGWVAVERRFNHSYKLINDLLESDVEIFQLQSPLGHLESGTFVMQVNEELVEQLKQKSEAFEIPLVSIPSTNDYGMRKVEKARIAIYQPWIPWAYDEGWLRLILDNFGFDYTLLHNSDFKNGEKLSNNFDVLIFGSQGSNWIVEGKPQKEPEPTFGEPKVRTKYTGGIGEQGVANVKDFLLKGGTVLFLGEACNFAIEKLRLPATNTLKEVKRKDFFAPGSIFEINLDRSSPLCYGMEDRAAISVNNTVALKLRPYTSEITEVGFYGNRNLLLSGWVVGENKLFKKVALADIPVGKGRAILYAFRVQHRGQTYGTFKLLFNALYE
ncbi:MAG: M14 metallopeptidase family protein [bacterium]